jgi:Tol biopolymer transport system component
VKRKTIIILSIILAAILLIGFCSYTCINSFIDSAKNMMVVMEDLRSGSKKQLTSEGTNVYPQFSRNGDYIYFINRPAEGSGGVKSRLLVYLIKKMKIIKTITPNADNISFTTSVLFDNKILGYLKSNTNDDICLYNISDGKIFKLTNDLNKKSNVLISPDSKWISYIEEDSEKSRSNVCIMPTSGGEKIKISNSDGMLSDVKIYSWSNDSKNICYITFLSLIVRSINGEINEKIDLAGLTNFKSILSDPGKPDRLYIIARESGSDLSYSIFTVSIKDKKYKLWKENRSFWEMNYSISPDGLKMVYSVTSK